MGFACFGRCRDLIERLLFSMHSAPAHVCLSALISSFQLSVDCLFQFHYFLHFLDSVELFRVVLLWKFRSRRSCIEEAKKERSVKMCSPWMVRLDVTFACGLPALCFIDRQIDSILARTRFISSKVGWREKRCTNANFDAKLSITSIDRWTQWPYEIGEKCDVILDFYARIQ